MSAAAEFRTTRWTLVLAAGGRGTLVAGDTAAARRALSQLCALYRGPLLEHARRRGLGPADAEDAVQGLFASLLRRASLGTVDSGRGRFRTWLLAAFEYHWADSRQRARAAKRGGGAPHFDDGAEAIAAVPAAGLAPDAAYDRAWALALLAEVTEQLRGELAAEGRAAEAEVLLPLLGGRTAAASHAAAAARLGLTEPALRVALHRLRQRYRKILRAAVAETVADPAEIDAELRHLLAAVAG